MSGFQPLTRALAALFSILTLFPVCIRSAQNGTAENRTRQEAHMAYLENEYYAAYTPCDEESLAGFDIDAAVASGVKFNEVAFIGTHNSYKAPSNESVKELYRAFSDATFGIVSAEKVDFFADSLTDQLQLGVRSLEIDIETVVKNGETGFVVCHDPLLDSTSNCYDFREAMREIKMWSDANPGHLPITVIIEPKQNLLPVNGMQNFTLSYARELEGVLREVLGETLLTPADMLREYDSFQAMRENDDWLPLGDTLGKVMILLHDTAVTNEYIQTDISIKTQVMFPMLRYNDRDKSYASFLLENNASDALRHNEESIGKYRLIVRTRADTYASYSAKGYEQALSCGSQILSTDYPLRARESEEHTFTFPEKAMFRLAD